MAQPRSQVALALASLLVAAAVAYVALPSVPDVGQATELHQYGVQPYLIVSLGTGTPPSSLNVRGNFPDVEAGGANLGLDYIDITASGTAVTLKYNVVGVGSSTGTTIDGAVLTVTPSLDATGNTTANVTAVSGSPICGSAAPLPPCAELAKIRVNALSGDMELWVNATANGASGASNAAKLHFFWNPYFAVKYNTQGSAVNITVLNPLAALDGSLIPAPAGAYAALVNKTALLSANWSSSPNAVTLDITGTSENCANVVVTCVPVSRHQSIANPVFVGGDPLNGGFHASNGSKDLNISIFRNTTTVAVNVSIDNNEVFHFGIPKALGVNGNPIVPWDNLLWTWDANNLGQPVNGNILSPATLQPVFSWATKLNETRQTQDFTSLIPALNKTIVIGGVGNVTVNGTQVNVTQWGHTGNALEAYMGTSAHGLPCLIIAGSAAADQYGGPISLCPDNLAGIVIIQYGGSTPNGVAIADGKGHTLVSATKQPSGDVLVDGRGSAGYAATIQSGTIGSSQFGFTVIGPNGQVASATANPNAGSPVVSVVTSAASCTVTVSVNLCNPVPLPVDTSGCVAIPGLVQLDTPVCPTGAKLVVAGHQLLPAPDVNPDDLTQGLPAQIHGNVTDPTFGISASIAGHPVSIDVDNSGKLPKASVSVDGHVYTVQAPIVTDDGTPPHHVTVVGPTTTSGPLLDLNVHDDDSATLSYNIAGQHDTVQVPPNQAPTLVQMTGVPIVDDAWTLTIFNLDGSVNTRVVVHRMDAWNAVCGAASPVRTTTGAASPASTAPSEQVDGLCVSLAQNMTHAFNTIDNTTGPTTTGIQHPGFNIVAKDAQCPNNTTDPSCWASAAVLRAGSKWFNGHDGVSVYVDLDKPVNTTLYQPYLVWGAGTVPQRGSGNSVAMARYQDNGTATSGYLRFKGTISSSFLNQTGDAATIVFTLAFDVQPGAVAESFVDDNDGHGYRFRNDVAGPLAPAVTLTQPNPAQPGNLRAHWQTSDAGSGVANYDVQWTNQFSGGSPVWSNDATHTLQRVIFTTWNFTVPSPGVYEIRVRATDAVGNVGPYGMSAPLQVRAPTNVTPTPTPTPGQHNQTRDNNTNQLGNHAPTIQLLAPTGGEEYTNTPTVLIKWSARDPDGTKPVVTLYTSSDQGSTWDVLVTADGSSFVWDVSLIESQSDWMIKAVASDGAATAEAHSDVFHIDNSGLTTVHTLGGANRKTLPQGPGGNAGQEAAGLGGLFAGTNGLIMTGLAGALVAAGAGVAVWRTMAKKPEKKIKPAKPKK